MFDSDRHLRAKSRQSARSRYIQFEMECLGAGFMSLPEMKKVNRLLKLSRQGLFFPSGLDPHLLNKFTLVHSTKGVEKIAALLILLEGMASSRTVQPLASKGYLCRQSHRDSARLERAFAHINRHLDGTLTLAETAQAASFSPQAFSRFFHQHIGMTFQDYVIDLRLTEACRLLIETDRTVSEICFQTGFNNLSNFNRHFLARKKMAPREYRKSAMPYAF
jgi:AraC-like DNA-binding protein